MGAGVDELGRIESSLGSVVDLLCDFRLVPSSLLSQP